MEWLSRFNAQPKLLVHPVNFEMISSEDGWSANLVFDRSNKCKVQIRIVLIFNDKNLDDKELSLNLTTL